MATSLRPPSFWASGRLPSIASSRNTASLIRCTPESKIIHKSMSSGSNDPSIAEPFTMLISTLGHAVEDLIKEMNMSVLIVTGIEGAQNCATAVAQQLGMEVEVADGRKAALAALRKKEYVAVVLDESLAECDPAS